MRERVAAVGGTLEVGPTADGWFRVAAHVRRAREQARLSIRVLLADDQALIRAGFRVLIDSADDLEVVGEAADGAEAVALARTTRADVVLMDIRMPGRTVWPRAAITSDEDLAGVRVLVLHDVEIDEYVVEAIRAGASGFIGKGADPGALLDAIRVIAEATR